MKLLAILIVVVCCWSDLAAQTSDSSALLKTRIDWLQRNTTSVRSSNPDDTDFSDLVPFGLAIGDARVVMLGEQTHGDGTTFLMKARLIKYLHERLGFNVLVFESGFFDMPIVWEHLKRGENAPIAFSWGLSSIWGRSAQVQPLIQYVGRSARTANPLEVAGIDDQLTAYPSYGFKGNFLPEFRRLIDFTHVDTLLLPHWNLFVNMLDSIQSGAYGMNGVVDSNEPPLFFQTFDSIAGRIAGLTSNLMDVPYWIQTLRSVRVYALQNFLGYERFIHADHHVKSSRDVQMGENLLWLLRNRYADRKVIVWAASVHISKNLPLIHSETAAFSYDSGATLGSRVGEELGSRCYCIGFIASQGIAGNCFTQDRDTLDPPPPSSLDGMMASTDHENAFIDLHPTDPAGSWLTGPFRCGAFGYRCVEGLWSKNFDGIVYTRTMIPSSPATR